MVDWRTRKTVMITFESVPEGAAWKLLRNSRLICYTESKAQAETTLTGYYRRTIEAGKNACIILHNDAGKRVPQKRSRS